MREGGEAALCVLASCEAPEREGDGLTSMGAGVVLSSTAVRVLLFLSLFKGFENTEKKKKLPKIFGEYT